MCTRLPSIAAGAFPPLCKQAQDSLMGDERPQLSQPSSSTQKLPQFRAQGHPDKRGCGSSLRARPKLSDHPPIHQKQSQSSGDLS